MWPCLLAVVCNAARKSVRVSDNFFCVITSCLSHWLVESVHPHPYHAWPWGQNGDTVVPKSLADRSQGKAKGR
eukprot:6197816-Pleurochrysis_carterae.AAC.2